MISKHKKNALILSVVVGTILNTINSYDVIWEGNFTIPNVSKIILTYITPFCVSLYSSKQAIKSLHHKI
jgi:hypothetical protein